MSKISFIAPRLDRLDEQPSGGLLGVFLPGERSPLNGVAGLVDWRLLGHLSRLVIDSFITGNRDEAVLVPLGTRLPHDHLVILGLGEPGGFSKEVYKNALIRLLRCADDLGHHSITLALPGRPEGLCETGEAIEEFLGIYDRLGGGKPITLIETIGAQKAMLPAVERWRLKHSVPPEP